MIDPARLRRALALAVSVKTDRSAFVVSGGQRPHRVLLDGIQCDCWDAALRGVTCKHQLAVRWEALRIQDPELLDAVAALVSP